MTPSPSNPLRGAAAAALMWLWTGCAPAAEGTEAVWWTQPDYRVLGPAVAVFALAMLVRILRRR